jgi:hypothetical protein
MAGTGGGGSGSRGGDNNEERLRKMVVDPLESFRAVYNRYQDT